MKKLYVALIISAAMSRAVPPPLILNGTDNVDVEGGSLLNASQPTYNTIPIQPLLNQGDEDADDLRCRISFQNTRFEKGVAVIVSVACGYLIYATVALLENAQ